MKYGERNIRIISTNMGDFSNINTFSENDIRMNNRKVDIACINETHNVTQNETETENYKIYFSNSINEICNNKGIGCAAITIRRNLTSAITNVRRSADRNLSIIIKTSNKNNINIINAYSPHMGYNKGDRVKYWKEINNALNGPSGNNCIIRSADNNGQISKDGENAIDIAIGNWTYSKKRRKVIWGN